MREETAKPSVVADVRRPTKSVRSGSPSMLGSTSGRSAAVCPTQVVGCVSVRGGRVLSKTGRKPARTGRLLGAGDGAVVRLLGRHAVDVARGARHVLLGIPGSPGAAWGVPQGPASRAAAAAASTPSARHVYECPSMLEADMQHPRRSNSLGIMPKVPTAIAVGLRRPGTGRALFTPSGM